MQGGTIGRRDCAEPGDLVMLTRVVVEEMPEHDVSSTFVNLHLRGPTLSDVDYHISVTRDERSGSRTASAAGP